MKQIIFETIGVLLGSIFFGIYKEYNVSTVFMGCMWLLTFFYLRKVIYFLKFMFLNSEQEELMLINIKIKKRYDCAIIQRGLRSYTDRFDFSVCEFTYHKSFIRKDRTQGYREYVLIEPLSSYSKKVKNKYTIFSSPIGVIDQ